MAPKRGSSSVPKPIPIGNCEVVVDAKNFTSESDQNSLQISLSRTAKIRISVVEDKNGKGYNDLQNSETQESCGIDGGYFVLVNPKDVDRQAKSPLQEVLNIYMKELPTMKYAANTGKQSLFLERCVSNGKYCTLLLKSKAKADSGEVVAAITYQIIPADTQYAEVPLAAVNSIYQLKGIGSLLYRELRNRLQSVGIRTVFCWGDKESEGFWLKQGFVSIGDVDTKGRARRLPIKSDIRKALCFPGGSTLMVSHLNKDSSANPEKPLKVCSLSKPTANTLPSAIGQIHTLGAKEESPIPSEAVDQMTARSEYSKPQDTVKDVIQMDGEQGLVHFEGMDCSDLAIDLGVIKSGADPDMKHCLCSSLSGQKRVWESSYTSMKSKKVKGGLQVDCQLDCWDFLSESHRRDNSCFDGSTSGISRNKSLVELSPRNPFTSINMEKTTEGHLPVNIESEDHGNQELHSKGKRYRIMLMNIADDVKKSNLSKIIEDLGGTVTSEGSLSTHVVTGKVRKTLNFCTALCSGAWIISPNWLKESFRKGRFVDEMPFILKDEDYELKYRIDLKDAVQRARQNPRALLHGFKVCLTAHLQPPVGTLSAIVRSAGGNVIRGLDKVNPASKAIFLACEEDMEESMSAIKKGIWTFSSEWFMNCIMRQELDLEAPQFAESL
ncbi:uncharacterized protein LOC130775524 isoform X1 [Actinidia eriantha]|uniref:uncharacterized protein LOC130775524 isoform X1 n=1 Tax=Actinidia eriantha TaxID=165200 RepID=UPI00258FACB3|nr:uncharacterized protein LOC130775524 isoform X1 [Actinidia eriantha]